MSVLRAFLWIYAIVIGGSIWKKIPWKMKEWNERDKDMIIQDLIMKELKSRRIKRTEEMRKLKEAGSKRNADYFFFSFVFLSTTNAFFRVFQWWFCSSFLWNLHSWITISLGRWKTQWGGESSGAKSVAWTIRGVLRRYGRVLVGRWNKKVLREGGII